MTKPTERLVVDFNHSNITHQKNLMTHLANLLKDFDGTPLQIDVIVYGEALSLVTATPGTFADHIVTFQSRDVTFFACQNAMRRFKVDKDQLLDGVGTVPSGVGAIVKKQLEGYVYLKG